MMRTTILLSLLVNVVVLTPVCAGLLLDANWVIEAYGPASPARGILLSVYASILTVSVWLLFHRNKAWIASLLAVQILYKITTPFTVGTLANPVVVSNLLVAALHTITLYGIKQAISQKLRS